MTGIWPLLDSLREKAREVLGRELSGSSLNPSEDEEARAWALLLRLVETENRAQALSGTTPLSKGERIEVARALFDDFFRLGPLQRYLEEEELEEIIVNRPDRGFLVWSGSKKEEIDPGFSSDEDIRLLVSRIVARSGRRIDDSSPAVDVRLADGSRLHAVLPPLSDSPAITIRLHRLRDTSLADLVDLGTLTREAAQFLRAAVEAGLNILVSGGTGSGKTTTLNALGRAIPSLERVITIEETAELRLREYLRDCVGLEERKANAEGVGQVSIRDLVRHALRMRPNRIIVGEVRGPEALDMLSAMNTGHEGSMGTIHASSARQALSKLQLYLLMGGEPVSPDLASRLIAETLDLIVHLRLAREGARSVTQIAEVAGLEGGRVLTNDLFRLQDGRLLRTGVRPRTADRLGPAFEETELLSPDPVQNGKWR